MFDIVGAVWIAMFCGELVTPFSFYFKSNRNMLRIWRYWALRLAVIELPSRKIIFPSRLLHGEKMQNSRFLPMFMLGGCFIFQDNVPLSKSPCFALCCREVSAFPCLRLGFYWRSDFDVYASSFLPAYQPASNNSLKSHVACFVYIVLFSTFFFFESEPSEMCDCLCWIVTGTLCLYGIIETMFVD